MTSAERRRFDALVDEAVGSLPDVVVELMDRVPLIVLDRPTPDMLREVGIDPGDRTAAAELCGLHTGVMNTEAGPDLSGEPPSCVHIFREGIVALAGGWEGSSAEDAVYEEIMVTILHEYGHQLGLDEEDLRQLGYD